MKKLALAALVLVPTGALAQDEPGAPRLGVETSSLAPALLGMEVRPPEEHPAWRLYHLAFEAVADGRKADALGLLRQITANYPDHPLAKRAGPLVERIAALSLDRVLEAQKKKPASLGRDSEPTPFSRAELVVFQTLHGIGVGTEICVMAQCDDARAIGATLVAGGGVGLGLSLLLTGDGITPGHTAALDTGTQWGAATGFFLSGVINPPDVEVVPGIMLGGQLLGLGLGHLAWRFTHGSSGDVSLVSSGGIWTTYLSMMTALAATNGDLFDEAEYPFGVLLASSLTGLGVGTLLADRFPMSRGRVLIMDGGGIVGGMTGLGIALIIRVEEPAPYFLGAGLGAAAGLALTAYLTRDWDVDIGREAFFNVVPTKGGAIVTFAGAW